MIFKSLGHKFLIVNFRVAIAMRSRLIPSCTPIASAPSGLLSFLLKESTASSWSSWAPLTVSSSTRGIAFSSKIVLQQMCWCQWEVPKYNALPSRRRYQSYTSSSLSSSAAEWKGLPSEGPEGRLILMDGKAFVYRAYHRISGKSLQQSETLPSPDYIFVVASVATLSSFQVTEHMTQASKRIVAELESMRQPGSEVFFLCEAKIFHGFLKKELTGEDLPENSSWDSIMTTVVALTEARYFETNLDYGTALFRELLQVVFDFPGCTFRHNLYAEYKSKRLVTPDTVRHAVRDTKHALLGMGVKVIEVPGVEADDVIGTLSVQAVEAGMKVRVASLDKDFFQIISPQLRLLRFQQKGSGFSSFGSEEFNLRYPGLQSSQFVDMQALVGDVVDNIPGVRGIGDITARKLISQFGTLENLLEQRATITQSRARNALLEDNGQVLLSKYLLLLKLNIPEFAIGCSLENLICQGPKDGGRSYSGLIDAFGAIVGRDAGADLLERTFEYWRKF